MISKSSVTCTPMRAEAMQREGASVTNIVDYARQELATFAERPFYGPGSCPRTSPR